ncbi:2-amino-4-hydroxy-6-hydroxymethyldihydropteridine diphosphokinase [Peribacillus asahii]|uniref:2-amino-4-hydroxy-6-hydroxymethyldihydropteridine diphosphokinase n=1 Tax=Peribacillus asahii TaxID=228899 RepID=A0A3T0KKI8_9BACI|nr:2-amino-4-hydroxy-6-hydroxymethyldihydropteridine diphosphokinase [Peribacillus asahii]AZV40823.1 2-amino-4-hydroxy-6-hydroxymethyldihydropteridine pyrophosphokinase [Peribacillus asahii]USK85262.1 2-amino-4-hydroxy-6-hydroxymethyldihydropteridine diphosphokinase [Peribacillus asahii]
MENIAYLSIGSNIGNRLATFHEALQLLDSNKLVKVVGSSSLYETDPVGYTDQDCFLNAVIKVFTSLSPEELLQTCLNIETKLGRKREIRWGPRTLDLDILLYNQENIETESLSVPHPRMQERAFVIVPLLELDPDIKLPNVNASLNDILNQIPDKEGVRLWKRKNGDDVFGLFES